MSDPRDLQSLVEDLAARVSSRRLVMAVVGDMILDAFIEGIPAGRHPEIGCPVLREATRQESIGGAANIGVALARLGIDISCFGVIGSDLGGRQLISMLDRQPLRHHHVIAKGWPTPRKEWIYEKKDGASSLIQRIDSDRPLPPECRLDLVGEFRAHCPPQVDVVILADHGLGAMGEESLPLIELARERHAKIVAIPRTGVLRRRKLDAIVTNQAEMRDFFAAETTEPPPRLAARYASQYSQDVFMTMLAEGLTVCPADGREGTWIPGYPLQLGHWMGARDIAAAIAAAGIAVGLDVVDTGRLANAFRHLIASQRGNGRVAWQDIFDFVGLKAREGSIPAAIAQPC
jgi:bifunctional ADP-heptose synthase (sugar kinase/adenylyltransferase)